MTVVAPSDLFVLRPRISNQYLLCYKLKLVHVAVTKPT